MDIRPCPRCSKLVPSRASFCRRCGVAMRPVSSPAGIERSEPDPAPARWAPFVTAAATATFAGIMALLAVSGPRVCRFSCDDPPRNPFLLTDPDQPTELASNALTRPDPFNAASRNASVPAVRVLPPPAPAWRRADHVIAPPAPDSLAPRILVFGGRRAGSGQKF